MFDGEDAKSGRGSALFAGAVRNGGVARLVTGNRGVRPHAPFPLELPGLTLLASRNFSHDFRPLVPLSLRLCLANGIRFDYALVNVGQ
jgi:hypothetical protein